MSAQTERDECRAIAIQCVAELHRGVQVLESEVIGAAGRRDVRSSINAMHTALKTLQVAVDRDGRWPGWRKPDPITPSGAAQ